MKILLDECLPEDLSKLFVSHTIKTVREMKWKGKKNGELLMLLVKEEFEAFVTIDSNLPKQQNLSKYHLVFIGIRATSNDIDVLTPIVHRIVKRIKSLQRGRSYIFD